MSVAKATEMTNLVAGIGKTGLSIARYLREHDADAIFYDTRTEPPGIDELREIWPEPRLLLGSATLPEGIERVIASPGIEEGKAEITAARKADIEVISDIQLFADEAEAPSWHEAMPEMLPGRISQKS